MKTTRNRKIRINKNTRQWQIQQSFGKFAADLNRLPDAAEVKRNPLRSAPQQFIQMLF